MSRTWNSIIPENPRNFGERRSRIGQLLESPRQRCFETSSLSFFTLFPFRFIAVLFFFSSSGSYTILLWPPFPFLDSHLHVLFVFHFSVLLHSFISRRFVTDNNLFSRSSETFRERVSSRNKTRLLRTVGQLLLLLVSPENSSSLFVVLRRPFACVCVCVCARARARRQYVFVFFFTVGIFTITSVQKYNERG